MSVEQHADDQTADDRADNRRPKSYQLASSRTTLRHGRSCLLPRQQLWHVALPRLILTTEQHLSRARRAQLCLVTRVTGHTTRETGDPDRSIPPSGRDDRDASTWSAALYLSGNATRISAGGYRAGRRSARSRGTLYMISA